MDVFGQVAAKRREIEEATKMNIAKSFQENISTTTEVEEEKVEKSMNDELDEVHRELFGDTLGEIEKAVYADTAQNRKLGRVGKEYQRGKGKNDTNSWGKKIASDAYQKQSYNLVSKKFSKYLNGEDDSTEFIDSYWRCVNNGADEKKLQEGLRHAIHNLVSPNSPDAKSTFKQAMADIKGSEKEAKKWFYKK